MAVWFRSGPGKIRTNGPHQEAKLPNVAVLKVAAVGRPVLFVCGIQCHGGAGGFTLSAPSAHDIQPMMFKS
jgi:hypothetical protein